MRKMLLLAAAAGCLLTLPVVVAPPAMADSVTIGPNGVTVRDNDRHHRHWRRHHADCRMITVRERHANGTVVVRKTRRC